LHRVTQEIFPETMACFSQPADAQRQAPASAGDHADKRDLDGHPRALDEQGHVLADDFPLKERIHECNPGKNLPTILEENVGMGKTYLSADCQLIAAAVSARWRRTIPCRSWRRCRRQRSSSDRH